jgi:hypothetical protein
MVGQKWMKFIRDFCAISGFYTIISSNNHNMRHIDAFFIFNPYLKSVIDILTNDGKIWMKIAINNRIGVISIRFFNYLTSDNGIFGSEKSKFCLFGFISYQ